MIVYITGKSGSGKSTFSKLLAKELNYKYIDVDDIGHKVYEYPEIMEKAYQLFGTDINNELGKFDRKKLGQIVFSERHSERVKAFSDLTWEYMKKLLDDEIVDNSVVDWILLPHTKYWANNALRILVKPQDEDLRFKKLMARDNITEEYVKLRDKASIEYNESEFDFVFTNDYNEEILKNNISNVVNYINSAITLTILGTQSPYAKENNACPSFLLSNNQNNLLLDCGSGSHRFFYMNKLNNLGIVISHLHRDHYNDLYNYMYSSLVMKNHNKLDKPISIYLPTQPTHIYEDIKNEKLTFSDLIAIDDKEKYRYGCYEVEFLKTIHSADILSYAVKVITDNKVIVYTGDCSYKSKQDILEFSKNADVLICEASFLVSHGFPKECNHLTALQAGEIAKEANVKKLILSHFWPEEDTKNYYKEARQIFNNVFIAKEKDVYLI